jgi:hypothetical protein
MKLSLSIESEEPEAIEPARWPSANFVTQIADALLRLSQVRPPLARTQRANSAYGGKIRIASEGRGKVLSRKI